METGSRSDASFGRFTADDLPAGPFAAFRAAARDPEAADRALRHAPARLVDVVPDGLAPGRTVFGNGVSVNRDMRESPRHRLKGLTSVMLRDAVVAPASMAVLSPAHGLFEPSVNNLDSSGGLLSAVDPAFVEAGPGRWRLADPSRGIPLIDAVALPVCGIGAANYGHFLYDGLGAALLHRELLGTGTILVGRDLLPWQRDVLDHLGLAGQYLALDRPTRFRKVIASDMMSWTVSYPNRFIRPLFDRLRARIDIPASPARRLLIRRPAKGNPRRMANAAEIEAIARAHGFETVDPATLDIPGQVRLFASAACVIGESGAALANLGFCEPGTRVLELQPDRFADGWTRAACHLLGLRWHVFFAVAAAPRAEHTLRAFDFTVDPTLFRAALETVFGAAP